MRQAAHIPRADALQSLNAAHRALREGISTEPQWATIVTRLETAKILASQGVLRGIRGHLATAEQALLDIQSRARMASGWTAPELLLCELDAVDTFVDLHVYQVRQMHSGKRPAGHRTRMNGGAGC